MRFLQQRFFSARFCAVLLVLLCVASVPARAQSYTIETIRGNVYRFTAGNYRSVFMVTKDGIIVTDPISKPAATWLKAQLAKRFNKPIRFVIYSHNHSDHEYGGEVFDGPGVRFVSHELARADLIRTKAQTRIPDTVFKDELTVYLGGDEVRLRYHGTNNGRGSISMLFEPASVLYVVDWIVLGRMPWKDLQGYDIQGMIDSTNDVLDMNFAVFVGGHGDSGNKQAVRHYRDYLEALYGAVLNGIRSGKTLPTLQREIRLDKFSDIRMYKEWLPLNIAGAYRILVDQSYMFYRPDVPRPKAPSSTAR
ncbi:MBL fold metallo-hydrolase [bacterium]|nr:MAG: MBL fold metallo-hydrolase [bacterium]